jgi:adenine deaminase
MKHRPIFFVSGFQLRAGAMASSLSPDDNNVVCVGTHAEDMALAINFIAKHRGGQIVVNDGKVSAFLQLPIGGLMSDMEPEEMAKKEDELESAVQALGCKLDSPFVYLIVLPIAGGGEGPEYAMTDRGLIDIASGKVVDPILGPA